MAVRDVQYGTRAVGHRRQRLVERPRRPSPRARSKGDGSRPDVGPAHERFWESSNRSACSGSAAVRSRVTAADSLGGPIWTGHSRSPPPLLRRRPPGWLRAPYGARASLPFGATLRGSPKGLAGGCAPSDPPTATAHHGLDPADRACAKLDGVGEGPLGQSPVDRAPRQPRAGSHLLKSQYAGGGVRARLDSSESRRKQLVQDILT